MSWEVYAVFDTLLQTRRRNGERARNIKRMGAERQRDVLDQFDMLDGFEKARFCARLVLEHGKNDPVPIAMAIVWSCPTEHYRWVCKQLGIGRCLLDGLLHFGVRKGFCAKCREDLHFHGFNPRDVKEKILAGQKIFD